MIDPSLKKLAEEKNCDKMICRNCYARLNLKAKKTVYSIYRESLFYLIMLTLFLLICISFFYNKNKRD